MPRLRLASRGSRLALLQAAMAAKALQAAQPGLEVEVLEVRTEGDARADTPIAELGGRGTFTKEVDARVLAGSADMAVHSCKDLPTALDGGLTLAALLARGPAHDVLLGGPGLEQLSAGARVGTGSPRRTAQLLRRRPDLRVQDLRGNVPTRVARLDGDLDAVVLAAAGLERLGLARPGQALPLAEFPTSPGQGAIALTARAGSEAEDLARRVDDAPTRLAVEAERAVLRALGAGCRTPMGCSAWREGAGLRLLAEVLAPDGTRRVRLERVLPAGDEGRAAAAVGEELRAREAELHG